MPNQIIRAERNAPIFGLTAKFYGVVQDTDVGRIVGQKAAVSRSVKWDKQDAIITAVLRFDDQCRNGHETFSITGDIHVLGRQGVDMYGCIHEEIAKYFPELEPLIKWHLVSTDGPMHYIANTVFHADNRDHTGLLKGEKRPILGPDKIPTWVLKVEPQKHIKGHEQPPAVLVEYEMWCRTGEGKERDLDLARKSAVWPDATDEELCQPRPQLEAALKARLPALMAEFKQTMTDIGFVYPEEKVDAPAPAD